MIISRLVDDIREESCVWSLKTKPKSEDLDEAWRRIAGKNKMNPFEVKMIFRQLSKKYKEERKKPKSTWNLFQSLSFLDEDIDTEKLKLTQAKTTVDEPSPPAQLTKEQSPVDSVPPKVEIHENLMNAQNTSDDDIYVELLEVGDEEDFSENDEPSSKAKAKAETPPPAPAQKVSTKPSHTLSVLKPTMLNNSLLKNYSSANTTPNSSAKTSATAATTARTPLVFPSLKRKLVNWSDSKLNGSEKLQPPEKMTKNVIQEKNEMTRSPTRSVAQQPAVSSQKDAGPPAASGKSSPNLSFNSIPDVDMNSSNALGLERSGVNIGDVISMPEIQKIKIETTDDLATLSENAAINSCVDLPMQFSKPIHCMNEFAPTSALHTTSHSRMYDSFGQYVSNTLNTLPTHLANRLELKVLEAIIAINTEKSKLV